MCLRKTCEIGENYCNGFCEKCENEIFDNCDTNWPCFCSICFNKCAGNDIKHCLIRCNKCMNLLSENEKPLCEFTKVFYNKHVVCDDCVVKSKNCDGNFEKYSFVCSICKKM